MIVAHIVAQQSDVMDWIQIGSTFGIPVLLLLAIGYFTARYVWPFVTKQIESSQAERALERDKFLEALERRDREFEKTTQAINNLAVTIQQMRATPPASQRSQERNR